MESLQDQATPSELAEGERIAQRRENPGRGRFFLNLNFGLLLTAAGISLFKAPNHFALGGTSGLSIILSTLFPQYPVGVFMWVVNAALVVLGLVMLDRKTIGWTVYSSFALSAFVSLFEIVLPMSAPFTSDTLLELCFAVLLPAIGSAIVFDAGASTGGTDIVAMVLKKYSSLEIGKALMVSDSAIVVAACLLYGPRTGLYCILGLMAKAFIVDGAIESFNLRKVCTVISDRPDDLREFLVRDLHRTSTVRDARGGFSDKPELEVVTVLTRKEATQLRLYLKTNDPHAFITMVNSSEIVGKGFRSV
ncbi:MAG: YitT family protein [Atopobiaceae bacterium]|jgi:uncharacterized membrane-anchored protein YitT (DUF2179 family)|nr:YitT family protein [Atopobiaceae bacterium]MCI2173725.1 YitT family protein [Atopobiaceae bacterium]MCI2207633.1 YitT family protein [Atopobiaceae bacterium]